MKHYIQPTTQTLMVENNMKLCSASTTLQLKNGTVESIKTHKGTTYQLTIQIYKLSKEKHSLRE